MRITAALCGAGMIALAFPSASAAGAHLSWNDCGMFGTHQRQFACNTDLGSHTLVGSFVSSSSFDNVTRMEAEIEILFHGDLVPEWWQLWNAGACRQNSLQVGLDFRMGWPNCADFLQGRGQFPTVTYSYVDPNRVRIHLGVPIVPGPPLPIVAGVEYYALRLRIDDERTVTEPCGACGEGALIALTELRLLDPFGVDIWLGYSEGHQYVCWQCSCFVGTGGPSIYCGSVPVHGRSWGLLKSLYR